MPGVNRQYRWPRLLAKLFDLKGSAPDLQVLDDVLPVAPLYDASATEHHFGRNEILWSRAFNISAGGAGQYFRIDVNVRPGYITVIQAVQLSAPAAGRSIFFGMTTALSASANYGGRSLDQRFELTASPGVTMFIGTVATAPAGEVALHTMSANVLNFIPVNVVIDSDDFFYVQANTANEAWAGTIYGYDRPIEESERG